MLGVGESRTINPYVTRTIRAMMNRIQSKKQTIKNKFARKKENKEKKKNFLSQNMWNE